MNLRRLSFAAALLAFLAAPVAAQNSVHWEAQSALGWVLSYPLSASPAERDMACAAMQKDLDRRRFGENQAGKVLLVRLDELDGVRASWPQVAALEMPPGCPWTHVVAVAPQSAGSGRPAWAEPSVGSPRFDLQWPDLQWPELIGGGLMLVAGLGAWMLARGRRAQLATPPLGAPIPLPESPPPHGVGTLERLLQERAELLAELQAAGVEVARDAVPISALSGRASSA